ncbi:MAG: hypothetical protein ABIS50_15275 [Luteolibacter sp.]|uniref:hypothetical protein n=1 Tax=Luteolibacter sp. TaxID=1962973 RepID=UPI0032666F26
MNRSRTTDFSDDEKIVGHEVEVHFAFNSRKPSVVKHWLGSETACRRKARMMLNFREIGEIKPVKAGAWKRTYGYGRI